MMLKYYNTMIIIIVISLTYQLYMGDLPKKETIGKIMEIDNNIALINYSTRNGTKIMQLGFSMNDLIPINFSYSIF